MSSTFLDGSFTVDSPNVQYYDDRIESTYSYQSTLVHNNVVIPKEDVYTLKTQTKVPKTGVMLVGWGGNNGTTLTAGILANKHKLEWHTKEGKHVSDYIGSLTQTSTVRLGLDSQGKSVYIPFKSVLPMLEPDNIVLSGWDISGLNLADSMERAQVLDYSLQQLLIPYMKDLLPLPSIYQPDFIASNQGERANNLIKGNKQSQMEQIRKDIRHFKTTHSLDKVIILWTANTERFSSVEVGLNTTAHEILHSIKNNADEVSPSTLFAVASILEGCSYINGSPQNTFVPGVIALAELHNVFIVGDDFKSGQTKMKSVLVDYLVSAGLKPTSIVSYNHLGNNDGRNLSAPEQFRSKEISKSNVVDDMVESNRILYKEGEHPDHTVVIKYVPYVGDSKRAMDEYTSEIFMGGKNTIVMHNTCEDSLLATPLMLDLIILCELCERIYIKRQEESEESYERLHPVLSLLSYLLKAPLVPPGMPVINALNAQRQALVNIFRACVGLSPENYMLLEHRIPTLIKACKRGTLGAIAATIHSESSSASLSSTTADTDSDDTPVLKKSKKATVSPQ